MSDKIYYIAHSGDESGNLLNGGTSQLGFELTRFNNGRSAGVEQLTLRCGAKSLDIIPTRGMGLRQAENQGVRFGWDSPIRGPVHPRWVPLAEPSGLGWLDGFDELMARCGLTSNGAPEFDERGRLLWPLHGRIANLPATEVTVDIDEQADRITARGVVCESRFHFYNWQLTTEISLQRESDEIEITDRVTNLSDRYCSFQMLYHNNFGSPVLTAGSRLHAAAQRVVPRNQHAAQAIAHWNEYLAPDPGFAEEVYFLDLASDDQNRSLVLLANEDETLGASVRFRTDNLPCFTLWKNTAGSADGYVTGLEPGTNFPNPRSFEEQQGRVVGLEPGQSIEFGFSIGMLVGRDRVQKAVAEIVSLSPAKTELIDQPLPNWSAPE
jgi:galactose mutarotase-like enzyme